MSGQPPSGLAAPSRVKEGAGGREKGQLTAMLPYLDNLDNLGCPMVCHMV